MCPDYQQPLYHPDQSQLQHTNNFNESLQIERSTFSAESQRYSGQGSGCRQPFADGHARQHQSPAPSHLRQLMPMASAASGRQQPAPPMNHAGDFRGPCHQSAVENGCRQYEGSAGFGKVTGMHHSFQAGPAANRHMHSDHALSSGPILQSAYGIYQHQGGPVSRQPNAGFSRRQLGDFQTSSGQLPMSTSRGRGSHSDVFGGYQQNQCQISSTQSFAGRHQQLNWLQSNHTNHGQSIYFTGRTPLAV